ncbi:alpha-tocopherol transfer protein-like isoform X2 [Culex pipiens pallens]|nr:alpha-tocopherol transfer protein-like isoform X2 [Culex pipiens pallens]
MDKELGLHLITIKEWLSTQRHLPPISDQEIKTFLHSNYYDLEKTKVTIENYYTFRTNCKDFFSNLDLNSEELQRMMTVVDMGILPQTTPEGYKIIVVRLADTDASKFSQISYSKFAAIALEEWLKEDGLAEGHVIIYDFTGCHLGHIAKLGIFPTKNYLYYIQEALPIRMKGMHFANIPSFVDKILLLMKPFMKRELYDVLHLHSTNEALQKFVPPNCLPSEYGGTAGPFKPFRDEFYGKLLANREAILRGETEKQVVESERASRGNGWFSMFRR